jgi:hypothetical protein
MKKNAEKNERSELLSKSIFILSIVLLAEFTVFEILMRNRQFLSKISVIQDNNTRKLLFIITIVIFAITIVLFIVEYLIKRSKIDK